MTIDDIKARRGKATGGKWEWVGMCLEAEFEGPPWVITVIDVGDDSKGYGLHSTRMEIRDENADFIANAPADIDWLIAKVERLGDELDEANALLIRMQRGINE